MTSDSNSDKSHDVSASATSGSGGGGKIGVAGSVALNVLLIDTSALVMAKTGTIAGGTVSPVGTLTYTSKSGKAPANGDIFILDSGTNQESVTVANVSGNGPYTLTLLLSTTKAHPDGTSARDGASVNAGNGSAGDVTMTGESTSTSPVSATPETQTFDPQSAVGSDNKTITLPAELKHADGSSLKTGDAVIYSAGGGTAIGCSGTAGDTCGLKDNTTYYAIVVTPGYIKLDKDKADAQLATPLKTISLDKTKATGTEHSIYFDDSTSVTVDPTVAANVSNNVITLPSALKHAGGGDLKSGDSIVYAAGVGNTAIGGLTDGASYYLVVVDSTHVKLDSDQSDATATTPSKVITLDGTKATGTNHTLTLVAGGPKTGIGASVALNIVDNKNVVGIQDGSSLTGAKSLTLSATGGDTLTTIAKGASQGGTSIAAVVAISISNATTTAEVGDGALPGFATSLTLSGGDLTATAQQTENVVTKGSGQAAGTGTAVGAALSLTVADHNVLAESFWSITAAGG
jgi:hypothetical protein